MKEKNYVCCHYVRLLTTLGDEVDTQKKEIKNYKKRKKTAKICIKELNHSVQKSKRKKKNMLFK